MSRKPSDALISNAANAVAGLPPTIVFTQGPYNNTKAQTSITNTAPIAPAAAALLVAANALRQSIQIQVPTDTVKLFIGSNSNVTSGEVAGTSGFPVFPGTQVLLTGWTGPVYGQSLDGPGTAMNITVT